MVDTAVFDVATSRLLFRAPGTHHEQENATLMDTGKELRKLRGASFVAATDAMIVNLDAELDGFREAVENGERAEVEWRQGSGGGGSVTLLLLVLLTFAALRRNVRRRVPQPFFVGSNRR
jgi:rhombotail lipoprotein